MTRGKEGEAHWNSKLTEEVVEKIRIMVKQELLTQAQAARAFQLNRSTISRILKGETWRE